MFGWLAPDVPPKSSVPSNADSESWNDTSGTLTTITELSGRVSVSVFEKVRTVCVGAESRLSTFAEPTVFASSVNWMPRSVPSDCGGISWFSGLWCSGPTP